MVRLSADVPPPGRLVALTRPNRPSNWGRPKTEKPADLNCSYVTPSSLATRRRLSAQSTSLRTADLVSGALLVVVALAGGLAWRAGAWTSTALPSATSWSANLRG